MCATYDESLEGPEREIRTGRGGRGVHIIDETRDGDRGARYSSVRVGVLSPRREGPRAPLREIIRETTLPRRRSPAVPRVGERLPGAKDAQGGPEAGDARAEQAVDRGNGPRRRGRGRDARHDVDGRRSQSRAEEFDDGADVVVRGGGGGEADGAQERDVREAPRARVGAREGRRAAQGFVEGGFQPGEHEREAREDGDARAELGEGARRRGGREVVEHVGHRVRAERGAAAE
mmetsp:Transcript_22973/g.91114  ORF Transcript_22973/g.91114 Transcript_22973/m.91114 type:complete len:233 (-) Transcript_22973:1368-2066(-)